MSWLKAKYAAAVAAIRADEVKLRRYARGFLLWASTVVTQVLAVGIEVAAEWTLRQWAIRLGISALAGAAGLINLGEKNPPPPENVVPIK